MKVIKRDGRTKKFELSKIVDAILSAAEHHGAKITFTQIKTISNDAAKELEKLSKDGNVEVETIQDVVVATLKSHKFTSLAKQYDEYRKERTRVRETKLSVIKSIEKIGIETDRDNANVGNNFSAKLLRIASEANK
jgi:ribonucleoside-triphosphate reductase